MDNRAQAIQIGFLFVVAIMLIGVSIYQADVVPGQNEAIEQDDYQTAKGDIIEVSDNIYASGIQGSPATITFKSGSQYRSRFFFQNPTSPQGTIRTESLGDYQVSNAVATDDQAADYWDGTLTWQAQTNRIVFSPDYNRITRSNHHITGGGVAYIDNENKHVIQDQSLISDTTVSIISIRGGLDASGQTVGLNIQPTSSETREVTLTDAGDPITISVPTNLSATVWENEIVSGQMVGEGGHIQDVQNTATGVDIVLEQGVSYTFIVNEVTVSESTSQTNASRPAAAYTTAATDTSVTVAVNEQTTLKTNVLSKFNTPVSNKPVSVKVVNGSSNVDIVDSSARTDANGQAQTVIQGNETGEATIRMYFDDASTDAEYVDYTINVGSGSGSSDSSYSVDWEDPSTITANDGSVVNCSADQCTWDPSKSGGELTLRSVLSPSVTGLDIDFGVSNQTQGTITPETATTGTSGQAETILQNQTHFGSVDVFAASGGSSDVITIIIDDDALAELIADFTYSPSDPEVGESVSFDASNSATVDGETIETYEWDWTSDGTYEDTGKTTTHTFSSSGTYDVTLRTTDSRGETDTVTKTIDVNAPPNADFTFSPDPSTAGESVNFDASASGDTDGSIDTYEWDWTSDGTFDAVGVTTSNTYPNSGSYQVTLRVTDNDGSTDTVTKVVDVLAPPNVDSITVTDNSKGNKATVDADWSVSDSDSNLQTVTLELKNERTNNIETTKTITVGGGSASGVTSLKGNNKNIGDDYTVIVTVTDTDNQTDTGSDTTPTS